MAKCDLRVLQLQMTAQKGKIKKYMANQIVAQ
jgi:hypothetical protein